MKKLTYLCVLLAVIISLLSACTPSPTATPAPTTPPKPAVEKVTLTASTSWVLNSNNVDGFKHFIDLVNERAKGQLEVQLKGGPEVVSVKESIGAVGKGMIDINHNNNTQFPISTVAEYATSFGVGFKVWEDKDFLAIQDKFYREKANAVILGAAPNVALFYMGTKKPVAKLDDVKGLRIRVHGGLSNVVVAGLGAAPSTIAAAEVYPALERGTVDGAMRPLQSVVDDKLYEVIPNIISQPLFSGNALFLMNQDAWNKLPPNLQKVLTDAAIETHRWGETYYGDLESKAVKTLTDKGVKFNTLSPEEYARWRKATDEPVKEHFLKEAGPDAIKLLDIVAKYLK